MTERFIELTNKEIKIYDADTTIRELVFEFCVNFFYAYVANVTTPFIVQKYDIGVFIGFFIYYYFSPFWAEKLKNRPKINAIVRKYFLNPIYQRIKKQNDADI